jgi:hypothetical protein
MRSQFFHAISAVSFQLEEAFCGFDGFGVDLSMTTDLIRMPAIYLFDIDCGFWVC